LKEREAVTRGRETLPPGRKDACGEGRLELVHRVVEALQRAHRRFSAKRSNGESMAVACRHDVRRRKILEKGFPRIALL